MSLPTIQPVKQATDQQGQAVQLAAGTSPWYLLCNDAHSALDSTYTTALGYLDPVKVIGGYDDDGTTAIVGGSRYNALDGNARSLYIDLLLRIHKDDTLANQPWPSSGVLSGYLYGFKPFSRAATLDSQIGRARNSDESTADGSGNTGFLSPDSANTGIWIPLADESGSLLLTLASSTIQKFHQWNTGHSNNATPKPRRNINFSPVVTCRTRGCTKFIFLIAEVPTWSQTPSASQILASFWS